MLQKMSTNKKFLLKRKRSLSPSKSDLASNDLYFVYESKRRLLWSNFKLNETMEEDDLKKDARKTTANELKSLFNICLTFIAKNVEFVEDFIGFPSQIGHLIFKECVHVGRFNFNETNFTKEEQSLKLFAQAYPDLIGNSFNFNSNPILLSYFVDIMKFCFIKFLDLSNCNLIIHENLVEILENSFNSLEVLNLSNNGLDEGFIKKFTLSQRLDIKNLSEISLIDLSDNFKLQPNCWKYFCNYKKLNEIVISVDKLKEFESSYQDYFRTCSCKFKEIEVKNDGWLKDVIESSKNISNKIRTTAIKGRKSFKNNPFICLKHNLVKIPQNCQNYQN